MFWHAFRRSATKLTDRQITGAFVAGIWVIAAVAPMVVAGAAPEDRKIAALCVVAAAITLIHLRFAARTFGRRPHSPISSSPPTLCRQGDGDEREDHRCSDRPSKTTRRWGRAPYAPRVRGIVRRRFFPLLALVIAGTVFLTGVERALTTDMEDFEVLFAGAVVFVQGGNPYDREAMKAAIGLPSNDEIGLQITTPSVFALLAPLAPLPLRQAELAWLTLALGAIALTIGTLLRLSDLRTSWRWSVLAVSACLLLGPFRTALWLGNTDIVALGVATAAIGFWVGGRHLWGTVLMALGICLKVHSIGLFAILFAFRGMPRAATGAVLGWIAINLFCALLLQQQNDFSWLSSWMTTALSAENDYNKVTWQNPSLAQLTHLRTGLHVLTGGAAWSGAAALLICLPLLARVLLSSDERGSSTEALLRELAMVALLGMLVVYHKFTGAVLLVFPLFWALHCLRRRLHVAGAVLVLICCAAALVNGQIAYAVLSPGWSVELLDGDSSFERAFLAYHFVWAQLAMLLALFAVHVRCTRFAVGPSLRTLVDGLLHGDAPVAVAARHDASARSSGELPWRRLY